MEICTQIGFALSSMTLLLMAALSNACTCMPPKHPQEHFCESDFVIRAYVESRTENWNTYTAMYNVQVLDILKQPDNTTLFIGNESDKTLNGTEDDGVEPTIEIITENVTKSEHISKGNLANSNGNMTFDKTRDYVKETPSEGDDNQHAVVLHTGLWGSLCGVHLNLRTTYLLGGRVVGNQLLIGLCGLHIEDDGKSLNKRQRAGFFRKYRDSCDCKIQYCTNGRCPPESPDQCSVKSKLTFTDFMNCANRYSMCKRRNGKCQWTKNRKHTLCQNEALRRRRYFRN